MTILSSKDPNFDLHVSDMSHAELVDTVINLTTQRDNFKDFIDAAFQLHPNLDLDVEYVRRLK